MAKIVTIKSVGEIWQNDNIRAITFNENDYECVIPKEQAIVGAKLVFIEANSILPDKPIWAPLRKKYFRSSLNGILIRPNSMFKRPGDDGDCGASVNAWGIAVPASTLELDSEPVGTDVTEKLGIRKFTESDGANLYTSSKNEFPEGLISVPSEPMVQDLPKDFFAEHRDNVVYTTALMDGQSVTAWLDFWDWQVFKFYHLNMCGRNGVRINNDEPNAFTTFAEKHNLKDKFVKHFSKYGVVLIIQAEQCGPGIQNNVYNFKDTRWFICAAKEYDPESGVCHQLNVDDMIDLANELELDVVPILDKNVQLSKIMNNVDDAISYAEKAFYKVKIDKETGKQIENLAYNWNEPVPVGEYIWKDYMRHKGIVVRSMDYDEKAEDYGFISFKVKNISYAESDLSKMAKAVRINL